MDFRTFESEKSEERNVHHYTVKIRITETAHILEPALARSSKTGGTQFILKWQIVSRGAVDGQPLERKASVFQLLAKSCRLKIPGPASYALRCQASLYN